MIFDPDDPTITAYVFDELEPADKREFESRLEQSPELQEIVRRTRATIESLQASFDNSARLRLSDQHRAAVTSAISAGSSDRPDSPAIEPIGTKKRAATVRRRAWSRIVALGGVAAMLLISAYVLFQPDLYKAQTLASRGAPSNDPSRLERNTTADMSREALDPGDLRPTTQPTAVVATEDAADPFGADDALAIGGVHQLIGRVDTDTGIPSPHESSPHERPSVFSEFEQREELTQPPQKHNPTLLSGSVGIADGGEPADGSDPAHLADFDTLSKRITTEVAPETWYKASQHEPLAKFPTNLSLVVSESKEIENEKTTAHGALPAGTVRKDLVQGLDKIIAGGKKADVDYVVELIDEAGSTVKREKLAQLRTTLAAGRVDGRHLNDLRELRDHFRDTPDHGGGPGVGGDKYDVIVENEFLRVADAPLSTFSIDVDTASYSKMRMFLNQHHQLPRPDAIRIEELVNYFPYSYEPPTNDTEQPFAAHQAVASCPWNPKHRLVRIGIKGKEIRQEERPASNLVFLLDVSGSMDKPNKLPLLKRGMKMLADQLSENDRVAIVVYAGAAGLVLDSTTGDQKATITKSLDHLKAGGSTNGGAGIQLAYQMALDHFITGGTNRVILCTDGDFNVGTTGTDELVRTVEQHAKSGVFLSVLGFGMGNHNDSMLEQISNKGNGNYAFVDTDMEARKVLVEQMSATLVTIAKDVKIQVEFNPAKVAAYRLIGYENRVLAAQDFNDDTKDAGEIGAGHTVTALYEVVPAGNGESVKVAPAVDELKYQTPLRATTAADSGELLTLKLRYKQPDGDTSTLLTFPLKDMEQTFNSADRDFQFAASVASFGMLLRSSKYKGNATYASVLEIATAAALDDKSGYREEFLQLVRTAAELAGGSVAGADE